MLPVVLPGRSVDEIPVFLRAHSTTHFIVSEFTTAGVFDLLAALSGVSAHPQPPRGAYVGPTFDSSTARTPAGARESTLLGCVRQSGVAARSSAGEADPRT